MPDRQRIDELLDSIYASSYVTNNGPYVKKLEHNLTDYLGVKNIDLVSNGTIALQIAIKALELEGEILTTPFSYVATLNSIIWEKCTPKFIDIDHTSGNVDANLILEALSDQTVGMMFTHVFSNPCAVERIDTIAHEHDLKVIYDAAHAFGVTINGDSVLNKGDISTLSFHATKTFHTIEGGALVYNDDKLQEDIYLLKSFGHRAYDHFKCGINGKLSEVHAIFGLVMLEEMNRVFDLRRKVCERYIQNLEASNVRFLDRRQDASNNFSYMPILFESESELLKCEKNLAEIGVAPRRYFYPSLNTMPYLDYQKCEVAEDFARKIMCLPLYPELPLEDVDRICDHI